IKQCSAFVSTLIQRINKGFQHLLSQRRIVCGDSKVVLHITSVGLSTRDRLCLSSPHLQILLILLCVSVILVQVGIMQGLPLNDVHVPLTLKQSLCQGQLALSINVSALESCVDGGFLDIRIFRLNSRQKLPNLV